MTYKFPILLLLVFLSALCNNINGQSFEELITSADHKYRNQEYYDSGKLYTSAFEIQEGSALHYYNAACSWSLAKDTTKALSYLIIAADKGWKNKQHIRSDKDLISLQNNSKWALVLQKVQANIDYYERDFDKPLQKELEHIYTKDQMLRQLYQEAESKG